MGGNVSRNTPVRSDNESKKFGGWTEQDLSNPKIMSEARELARVTTNNIQAEPNFGFNFNESTIDVTDLTTQVVNGTNYRIEYSIRDSDGDHVLFVTATLFRGTQTPFNKAEVVKKDYALENVNRPKGAALVHDKNATMARQQPRRFINRRQGA